MKAIKLNRLLSVILAWMPLAHAASGVALEAGRGDDSTDRGQISLTNKWNKTWFAHDAWHLGGYWDFSLGHWRSSDPGGRGIWDLGLTPVFRVVPNANSGLAPYLEGGVGVHFISKTHVNDRRDMSIVLQFGSHLGGGVLFGDKQQFELGYRFQHISNASIRQPNDGINFHELRVGYSF